MHVIRAIRTVAIFAGISLSAHVAFATSCANLPTSFGGNEFPTGDFFSNFNNTCYTIRLGTGYGSVEYGDTNATYYQMFFKVDPRYQIILLGNFPNARYFSVSLNDAHSALSGSIRDTNIVPLTSQYVNPYLPGVPYVSGQQYAVPVSFGGTPGKQETGCEMNGYNVTVNGLDATQRHPGMDWNSDPSYFAQYPSMINHDVDTPQHTNPNTAGVIMVRAYVNASSNDYNDNPHIIVRDVASGCAYPADYAMNTLQILSTTNAGGQNWLDHNQFEGHHTYETDYLPKLCNARTDPSDSLRWSREPDYIPLTNPDAAYVVAPVPYNLASTLASSSEVMRIRVRVPSIPPTPCTNGCSRSGEEQMRYMSLSFVGGGGSTLTSLADTAFTRDSNGYATLIVGTGATVPSWVTPANGYTYLDLTKFQGYDQFSLLALRHIIPGSSFNCAANYVPYRTSVDTPIGSLLGDYTPVVDYPVASSLPKTTSPLVGLSACGAYPLGEPGVRPNCGVFPGPIPSISSVVTQCSAPGCTGFVAQNNPPITIVGAGFGVFPEGAPFTGTSKYVGLEDVTQNWYAGYAGAGCDVSISEWDTTRIQLVADVPNTKGKCHIKSGDKLKVVVWNPQTLLFATYKTTAQ